ncbi:MAG: sigma-70 family RNA polymerase sigma factor [Gemmataceae bacterium]
MKKNPAGRGMQTIPADPAAIFMLTRKMLYCIAKRTLTAYRNESPGHPLPDLDELVNEGFAALLDVLPRWNASKGKLTTYAYGVFRRAMWVYARAAYFGLAPQEYRRLCARKATPRYHHGTDTAKEMAAPVEEAEQRQSVRRVDAIRRQLPREDRRLVELFLEEGGNYSAVARRLGRDSGGMRDRYHRLFRRVRSAMA